MWHILCENRMPTQKHIEWLQSILEGDFKKQDDPHKYSVYRKRLRDNIDAQLDRLEWIAEYFPSVLTDEEHEIQEYGHLRHRRLRKLMSILDKITPDADPILSKARKYRAQEQ